MIFTKPTKVLKNATPCERENLLAGIGCRHHRVCKTLYNLHKTQSNSGNTTNDTLRHTRRPMARFSSRLFSSQQHQVHSHCRHIQQIPLPVQSFIQGSRTSNKKNQITHLTVWTTQNTVNRQWTTIFIQSFCTVYV